MVFYRLDTDHTRTGARLENLYAGPLASACWLIGGGPSLADLPMKAIAKSPIPKMCLNLSGTRLLRPTFWTSYDPTARFHRSVYLDPSVMKFVHHRRAMDLVPETTFKVCECPNTFFFDRNGKRGFADFLSPSHEGICDWADTMVQAIDILYRLGFRTIYLAGCEMRVRPSAEQIDCASKAGVSYDERELLHDFLRKCRDAGVSTEALDKLQPGPHYHFDEFKPLAAAATTDQHYFRVSQYLRLCRRSLSLAGVRLVSVTEDSRLNEYVPYRRVRKVLRTVKREIGDPSREPVRGMYTTIEPGKPSSWGPMRDFRPHNWSADEHETKARHQGNGQARNRDNGAAVPVQADGEILVEAEGFERAASPKRALQSPERQRLQTKLKRIPDGFFDAPMEEG